MVFFVPRFSFCQVVTWCDEITALMEQETTFSGSLDMKALVARETVKRSQLGGWVCVRKHLRAELS